MSAAQNSNSGNPPHKGDARVVLVTGGSGFVGRQIVRRLADDGCTVVSMYHRRLPEAIQSVYPVCSDMASAELLAAPLRGVDTVVHLAWDGNFIGPTDPTVEWNPWSSKAPVNVQNTRRLVLAMERAKIKRLIFVSALGAGRGVTDPFLREKYLAEHVVLNSSIPERFIVRPSVVCAGNQSADKFINAMTRVMKIPGFYPVPRQKSVLAPLHSEDLTRLLANLTYMDFDEHCALIEVPGGASYKMNELLRMVSDKYAGGSRIALGGVLGEWAMSFLERNPKEGPPQPQLKHFLSMGKSQVESFVMHQNPLTAALPPNLRSFKDIVGFQGK